MAKPKMINILQILCFSIGFISCKNTAQKIEDSRFISYIINPKNQDLKFYLKNKDNVNFFSFQNLKTELEKENKKLIFATNGGMFNREFNPQGLYIENGKTISLLDTLQQNSGNFYLLPNGVFYLTKEGKPVICKTEKFKAKETIKYATQSSPMLVIGNNIHPKFTKGSKNMNIRNGVGIRPNDNIVFVMSKGKINFYDFALYFKSIGCKNALYLDGFVSRTYLPSKNWIQLDGGFGVIVAETEKLN
ncbi:phosphodiester glycosidase family protein [Mariniflexile sp.]|uniref:phosphodiester glycosidase family protein n=1 Tax=Mariniflexile sp. TaxID=1979402 RepID=UPI004047A10D